MREAEVLRDYLLRRFAEDSTLRPRDVVVMMPDPEGYAPYLRAAFGGMEEACPSIFLIPSWIEPGTESQIVDCFFDLLEFFEGRATNREVLDLLDSSVFRLRFELDDEDMVCFRRWIRECHAHWGLDGDHRQNFGSTKTDEHTWRHALDRMALGFCQRGNGEHLWEGVLPMTRSRAKMPSVLPSSRKSSILCVLWRPKREVIRDCMPGLIFWNV